MSIKLGMVAVCAAAMALTGVASAQVRRVVIHRTTTVQRPIDRVVRIRTGRPERIVITRRAERLAAERREAERRAAEWRWRHRHHWRHWDR